MAVAYIKYLFITLCGTYSFTKTLNIQRPYTPKEQLILGSYHVLFPLLMWLLRQYIASVSIIIMVLLSGVLLKTLYGIRASSAITATMISYGITYTAYAVGSFFPVVIAAYVTHASVISIALSIMVGILQMLLVILFFRIKRMRHGFPFLAESRYDDIGVLISTFVLVALSFLSVPHETHLVFRILICSVLICAVMLWFWCRKRMEREYVEQLKRKENERLNNMLAAQNELIESLQKENDELSKIIHKDNKLLPALSLSTKEFLQSAAYDENCESRVSGARKLIEQLNQLSQERAGALSKYELSYKKVPKTGVATVDILLSYMQQKASASNISFDLNLWGDIGAMVDTVISEQDLTTVLGDLIENAIIAISACPKRRILVDIGMPEEIYCISVRDSGVPFPAEVIENWGVKRITTHADSGGSGIGMMSTHEICKRYRASFRIVEFEQDALYSKQISVLFDGREEFAFKASNAEQTHTPICAEESV